MSSHETRKSVDKIVSVNTAKKHALPLSLFHYSIPFFATYLFIAAFLYSANGVICDLTPLAKYKKVAWEWFQSPNSF